MATRILPAPADSKALILALLASVAAALATPAADTPPLQDHFQSEAIYHETLMTPGELQHQKTRLLLRIREQSPAGADPVHSGPTERLIADWLKVADWLKNGEDHWSGRKKEEIAYKILATERVAFRILASAGMDRDLAARPFVPNSSKVEPIAQQILSAEDAEASGQLRRTKDNPAAVV